MAVEVPVVMKDGRLYPEKIPPFPNRLLNFVLIPRMLRMEWGLEDFLSGEREMLRERFDQKCEDEIGKTGKRCT